MAEQIFSNPAGIKLIVGLGNPGPQYKNTRHNLGFEFLDHILQTSGSTGVNWREHEGGAYTQITYQSLPLILLKPMKFMNRSGAPLRVLLTFFKIDPNQMLVCHDDIDIPFGTLRIKQSGGDGGHNGLRSIFQELGSRDFLRFKFGVGRPPSNEALEGGVSRWVLAKFSAEEEANLKQVMHRGLLALDELLRAGVRLAQTRFNTAEEAES